MIIDVSLEIVTNIVREVFQDKVDSEGEEILSYDFDFYTMLPSVEIEIPYIPQIGSRLILTKNNQELLFKKFETCQLVPFVRDQELSGLGHYLVYDLATSDDIDSKEFLLKHYNDADHILPPQTVSQVVFNEKTSKIIVILSFDKDQKDIQVDYLADPNATKNYLNYLREEKDRLENQNGKTVALDKIIKQVEHFYLSNVY